MTLLIAWLLLYMTGVQSMAAYIGVLALWVAHIAWHSTATNKIF